MNTEQERAAFEAACRKHAEEAGYDPDCVDFIRDGEGYANPSRQAAWWGWKERAALQSQDLEDAERLEWLVENMCRVDIDEGHRGWFVLERDTTNYLVEDCKTFREAIDHARRIEGGNHE